MSEEAPTVQLSTADSRATRFEVVSIRQYGHSRGGFHVEAVERDTEHRTTLDISTELMGDALTKLFVDGLTQLENIFSDVFDAKASAATPENRHAAVREVEEARAKKEEHEAEAQRLALANAEAARALQEKLAALGAK